MTREEWCMLERVAPVWAWLSHPEVVKNALKYIRAEKRRIKSPRIFQRWTESYLSEAKIEGRREYREEAEEKAKQLQEKELKLLQFIEGIFKEAKKGRVPTLEELLTVYTKPCPFHNGKTDLYVMMRHYACTLPPVEDPS